MANEPTKPLSHQERCDNFKAEILGLSKDDGFAKVNNLDERKLRAECINIIHVFEGFTGNQAGQNRENFMKCTKQSIILCVIKVVSSKYLTFEKKLGLCFLVPQNAGESMIMTLSFGYPAYQAAALSHGISINVQTVREGDTYSNEVINGQPTFMFKQAMFGSGTILGYVAYSIDLNGFKHVVPMTVADISKRRKVAKTDYVWSAWEEEMSLKTPLLRLCSVNYRHLLADLLEFDTDNDYEGLSDGNNGRNSLPETSDEKKPLTEEEKTALKESLSSAETRDLAMIELGRIELVYKERDTEISAKGRKYLIETFIDSRFNVDGSPKLELAQAVETPSVGAILITPYKPTAEILKDFGACKTMDDLNDRINLEITDLTLNNYDTAPFMEYAVRLREAFNMKTK